MKNTKGSLQSIVARPSRLQIKGRSERTAAGVGIFLLEKHLAIDKIGDCKAGILDLRKRDLLVYDALPPNVQAMVTSELAWDVVFRDEKKAA